LPSKEYFIDDEFHLNDHGQFHRDHENDHPLEYVEEWLRPFELVEDPKIFSDGSSRRDVIQGKLGEQIFPNSQISKVV